MKKMLLFAAVALASATAGAQKINRSVVMDQSMKLQPVAAPTKAMLSSSVTNNGRMKSVESKLWYQLPEGMPAVGWLSDGRGSMHTMNVIPAFTDFTLTNKSTNPTTTKWSLSGEDISDGADENGNFVGSLAAGYYMPDITLSNATGTDNFAWGDLNIYKNDGGESYYETFPYAMPMTWTDPHVNPTYYGFGYLDSYYIFGTGKVTEESTVYDTYGYYQPFAKPLSPMYVEYMYVQGLCFNTETPIPTGEKIILCVVNRTTQELIAELTCEPEDINWMKDDNGNINVDVVDGNMKMRTFFAVFSQKVKDELSGEMAVAPFVINTEFDVYIYYSENSNFGMYGHSNKNGAETFMPGYNLVYNMANPEEENGFTCRFSETEYASAPIYFYGLFDYASVWEEAKVNETETIKDFNVLKISDDGKTVTNVGYPEFNFVQVYTGCQWFDEDMNENYYLDVKEGVEYPDWYIGCNASDEMWNNQTDFAPIVMVTVETEALPTDVTGRGCKLYVHGRGYTSEEAIYILQGDYTKEQCDIDETTAGVENVVTKPATKTNTIFNLAGQKVNNSFKGIVIKDGKKFLRK